jgi:hypothetical protein
MIYVETLWDWANSGLVDEAVKLLKNELSVYHPSLL